jgi:hypothetical protein
MQKLAKLNLFEYTKGEQRTYSHPATKERIEEAEKFMAKGGQVELP